MPVFQFTEINLQGVMALVIIWYDVGLVA